MKKIFIWMLLEIAMLGATASFFIVKTSHAKIPVPVLTDEQKAKADEVKAKTAWGDKVAAYKLCLSMDAVAKRYFIAAKAAGKEAKPNDNAPACADPGAFVYPLPVAVTAVVVTAAVTGSTTAKPVAASAVAPSVSTKKP